MSTQPQASMPPTIDPAIQQALGALPTAPSQSTTGIGKPGKNASMPTQRAIAAANAAAAQKDVSKKHEKNTEFSEHEKYAIISELYRLKELGFSQRKIFQMKAEDTRLGLWPARSTVARWLNDLKSQGFAEGIKRQRPKSEAISTSHMKGEGGKRRGRPRGSGKKGGQNGTIAVNATQPANSAETAATTNPAIEQT